MKTRAGVLPSTATRDPGYRHGDEGAWTPQHRERRGEILGKGGGAERFASLPCVMQRCSPPKHLPTTPVTCLRLPRA